MGAVAVGGLAYLVNTARTPADRGEELPTFPIEAALTPSPRGQDPAVADRQFVWHKSPGLDASAVVPLGDGFLVFDRSGDDAGAHLQTTNDGKQWTDLGNPIVGEFPAQVTTWRGGAVGVFVDSQTGNLSLWHSPDGANWRRGTNPPTPRTSSQLEILGEMNDGLLVHAAYDGADPLANAIRLSLEGTYSPRDFFIEVSDTAVRVVHRFLLVEVASFDRAEMGWARTLEGSPPADLGYWWSEDLSSWDRIEPGEIMDGFHPIEVFDTGNYSYLVGRSGSKLYVSEDGVEWAVQPLPSSWLLTERDGEFVEAAYGATEALLVRSDDLRKWAPLDAPKAFTERNALSVLEGGPLGVAGIVHGPVPDAAASGFVFEIEDGGSTVVYDLTQGTVTVTENADTVWTAPMLGIGPDLVSYDPYNRVFHYLDPATGTTVATASADELAGRIGDQVTKAALVFTTDYETWIVEYLPGAETYVVAVGPERVALVIGNQVWIGQLE